MAVAAGDGRMPATRATDLKVSIVMAARNTAEYVGAAIESALAQTHTNLEVLVVGHGPAGGPLAEAERYARRDARVRVVAGSFDSLAAARNRAIAESTGDCLALLDSDDMWGPTFLERQLDRMLTHPGAMLVSANAVHLGGPSAGGPLDAHREERALRFADLLRDETAVCVMTLFRRAVIDAIGAFDPALEHNEDYDLWLRATYAGFVIVKNPEPLGYYRGTPQTAADEEAAITGILKVYRKVGAWSLPPEDRAILDRQVARFERRRLVSKAKLALAAHDFAQAADLFGAAGRRGAWKATLAAVATRCCPGSLVRFVARGEAAGIRD